jgi:hypothetical protein
MRSNKLVPPELSRFYEAAAGSTYNQSCPGKPVVARAPARPERQWAYWVTPRISFWNFFDGVIADAARHLGWVGSRVSRQIAFWPRVSSMKVILPGSLISLWHDRFLPGDNFGRSLRTLTGLTPYEFICKPWTTEPKRFGLKPLQQLLGLDF